MKQVQLCVNFVKKYLSINVIQCGYLVYSFIFNHNVNLDLFAVYTVKPDGPQPVYLNLTCHTVYQVELEANYVLCIVHSICSVFLSMAAWSAYLVACLCQWWLLIYAHKSEVLSCIF